MDRPIPYSLTSGTDQTVDDNSSVIVAFGKLKHSKDDVDQLQNRLQALKRKCSKESSLEHLKKDRQTSHQRVQDSFHRDRKLKQTEMEKRKQELETLHEANLSKKHQNKLMIQTVRSKFYTTKNETFEMVKKNRESNEKAIRSFRQEELEKKIKNREMMSYWEEERKERIKKFRENRYENINNSKVQERDEVLKKAAQKKRELEFLAQQEKVLRESRLKYSDISNPEK